MVDRAGFEPAYGKPGQIYSLLPLTTRPPVQCPDASGKIAFYRAGGALNGEWRLACQWPDVKRALP